MDRITVEIEGDPDTGECTISARLMMSDATEDEIQVKRAGYNKPWWRGYGVCWKYPYDSVESQVSDVIAELKKFHCLGGEKKSNDAIA